MVRAEEILPWVEPLAAIAQHCAPVHVEGSTNVGAALAYTNLSQLNPTLYHPRYDLPRRAVLSDIHLSAQRSAHHPRFAVVSAGRGVCRQKLESYPTLMFTSFKYARSVHVDTNFAHAPPVDLGRVLRNSIWRIFKLRRRFGPLARTVLSKIDVTKAFR